jgi:hypothetical protein
MCGCTSICRYVCNVFIWYVCMYLSMYASLYYVRTYVTICINDNLHNTHSLHVNNSISHMPRKCIHFPSYACSKRNTEQKKVVYSYSIILPIYTEAKSVKATSKYCSKFFGFNRNPHSEICCLNYTQKY